MDSPGQNTGVGSCSLLPGIFPTQGLNPGLWHCRWILYQLSHQGSPRSRLPLQLLACILGCQEQKVITVRPWEAVRGCTHPTNTPNSCFGSSLPPSTLPEYCWYLSLLAPAAAAAAKSLQLCPTLCDPIDSSPPGFPSLGFSRQEHWSGLPPNSYGLPRWLSGKESTCHCRIHGFNPWVGKIPWRRKWQPTSVFLPGKFHRQKNLVGYSPWDHKESDTT